MSLPIAQGASGFASQHYAGSADISLVTEAGESGNETASLSAKQSRCASFIEALANIVAGVGVAISAQVIIFPWFGLYISFVDTSLIALIFTGISLIRSYCLRRCFEWLRISGIMP